MAENTSNTSKIIKRAYKDTVSFFEWSPKKTVIPFFAVCIGIWLRSRREVGAVNPIQEIWSWFYGSIQPLLVITLGFILWNLIRAPFRIKNERIAELEGKLGSHEDVAIISKSHQYSVQAAIYMILGENPSEAASLTLRENISDYIRKRNINALRKNEKLAWLTLFAGKHSDNVMSLTDRVNRNTLISFIRDKNIDMPEALKDYDDT